MLTRWQNFGDIRAEMNRLHGEMNHQFGRHGDAAREFAPAVFPPLNVWEDEHSLFVEAELPGFDSSDLAILVTADNELSMQGERKQPDVADGSWLRRERGYGKFSRQFALPAAVNGEQVSAEFKLGVLTVTLPKREETKPRRIEVKS